MKEKLHDFRYNLQGEVTCEQPALYRESTLTSECSVD